MELKQDHTTRIHIFSIAFNRTSMELKHAFDTLVGEGFKAFNRTSMELKRVNTCACEESGCNF